MPTQITSISVWSPYVIIIAIIGFFYLVWPWPNIRLYIFRKRFFKAIIRVTTINDKSNESAKTLTLDQLNAFSWGELKLDFKRLMEKNSKFKSRYKNASELFEECLYYIDTKGQEELSSMTGLKVPSNTRAKSFNL